MTRTRSRRGIALMWVLIVLSVLSVTATAASWQFFAARRVLEARQHKLQAAWLARSAVELAAAKLLNDGGYQGGTVEIVPDSQAVITVQKVPEQEGAYRIHCDVRLPVTGPNPIALSTSRIAKLKKGDTQSTIELTMDGLTPRSKE